MTAQGTVDIDRLTVIWEKMSVSIGRLQSKQPTRPKDLREGANLTVTAPRPCGLALHGRTRKCIRESLACLSVQLHGTGSAF